MPDFEKIATAVYDSLGRGSDADAKRILRALREVHNSALEDAAVVAELLKNARSALGASHGAGIDYAARTIANDIRSLKVPEGQK